ncbi:c-type cytochrome [Chitinophagaceae bacterium LB-8]|uniref:C-type cytochrome n=1 Tax=Paraflavisolibacter caeni TaxID=2982496 RepID=A0A9X2XPY9_9BACT|nr:c-type cytochrome [Paraflavisolibacter caeni]MCU7552538.1 c-type cytochrome [Paraflavisolibacter caeni]
MKRNLLFTILLVVFAISVFQCTVTNKVASVEEPKQKSLRRDSSGRIIIMTNPSPAHLSPQDGLNSIYVPKGYHLELVASEPMIKEPVSIVWDGNGKMYVTEMLTYMQDVNGSNENAPVSRISLLEDTNGDGVMDKNSVYIDSLLLPRMMLCVGKKLLVSETYTNDIWSYEDLDNDGKADRKEKAFGNSTPNTANLEHQRSGLIWNLDNRIYTTYENLRYRYVNGKLEADTLLTGAGQWGLGNDDYGRLFYSSAGGEVPAYSFQLNPRYGSYDVKEQLEGDFNAVWPIIATPDVQGGYGRLRPDSTLNHFTASCGQSVFRGNALPADLKGDLLICEPVGRLIRRAKVKTKDGISILSNAYDHEEFIASTDMNFRPVNTITGPDGCLYIVDMHRGIIQEGNWTKEGSYLRPQIVHKGLDKNIGHGRIYRLVHDEFKPGPKPAMLQQSSSELVNYLAHANGWWRDNAQKELIIRGDRSVIPALQKMAKENTDHLARIHALWTLEGLHAMNHELLSLALKDNDARVRKTAILLAEEFLKKQDAGTLNLLSGLVNDPDADVQAQLAATLSYFGGNESTALLEKLLSNAGNKLNLVSISKSVQNKKEQKMYGLNLAGLQGADKTMVLQGREIFQQVCATCHGGDGKGISIGGNPMPAPPLVNSNRAGDKAKLINILLNGLTGPVNGKTYSDVMAPLGAANSDEWVAKVLSYVHFRFRPAQATFSTINPEEVKKARTTAQTRTAFWTIEELENKSTVPATSVAKSTPVTASGPEKKKSTVVTSVAKSKQLPMEGKALIAKQDCSACHRPDVKLVGPSYKSIAQKYKASDATVNMLAAKVMKGGAGNWGQIPMTPHTNLSAADAKKIVRYILSLSGNGG